MKVKRIYEGKAQLIIPDLDYYCKVGSAKYEPSYAPVFYNPEMAFGRSLSILVLRTYQKIFRKKLHICDALAGTGVRGIRYSLEVPGIQRTWLNDKNPLAVELIERNIRLNLLEHLSVISCLDANLMLLKNSYGDLRFDVIDIDPFGSPINFVESSIHAIKDGGLLCLTATDIPPLYGKYPDTCLRRYSSISYSTEFSHELAIRILVGAVARKAAQLDFSCNVLFSHYTRHYIRVYITLRRSVRRADESLKNLGYIVFCNDCNYRMIEKSSFHHVFLICPFCGTLLKPIGPLWCGPIFNKSFLKNMENVLLQYQPEEYSKIKRLLKFIGEEADGPPTFYVIDKLTKRLKVSSPKLKKVIEQLQALGFFASRTHFHPKGLRTNAPLKVLYDVVRSSL